MNVVSELYPELDVRAIKEMTAFFVRGEQLSVIDIMLPHGNMNGANRAATIWVKNACGTRYRIPTLEAALAHKYGAMLDLDRDVGTRQMDAVDFSWMVKHSTDEGRQPIDLEKLAALGELVWPGGGGREILRFVEASKRNQVPDIVRRLDAE